MKSAATPVALDRIIADAKAANPAALWRNLTMHAAADMELPADFLYERVLEQERHSPAGIGDGVAIAPLRLRDVTRPYLLFARSGQPLAFKAIDSHPVDLFFLLLSPEADITGHLQRLSALSRLMRDENLRASLRSVANADGLSAVLLTAPEMLRAA